MAPPQFIIQPEETGTEAPLSAAVTALPPALIGGVQTRIIPGPPAGCFDAAWARAVTDHVQQFFYYPGVARALHATGLVMVHFIEGRDGSLDMVEVGKSSGEWALDNAAIDIMRKAQPLPAIPDRMHMDWIDLQLPIDFGIPNLHLTPTPGNCGRAARRGPF